MNKYVVAALLLPFSTCNAAAALSGFYDSGEQISAILSSEAVASALRQAPIATISNTGTRVDGLQNWEIGTKTCRLKIYLKPKPPIGVGKTTYSVRVPGKCR